MSIYTLKEIYFQDRYLKILCQNENGPCPLLSLCNSLLLTGQITIHNDYSQITLGVLMELLAERILQCNNNNSHSNNNSNSHSITQNSQIEEKNQQGYQNRNEFEI